MKTKPIYLFSNKITYKRFKKVWDKFPVEGVVAEEMVKGKIIWEMIRDKQIYVYIEDIKEDKVFFALKLPKNRKLNLLTNSKEEIV
jgi:predicted secreted Zn-dependent protease